MGPRSLFEIRAEQINRKSGKDTKEDFSSCPSALLRKAKAETAGPKAAGPAAMPKVVKIKEKKSKKDKDKKKDKKGDKKKSKKEKDEDSVDSSNDGEVRKPRKSTKYFGH